MRQSFARCFSPNASASHDESILTIKDSGVNGPTRRARRSKFARSGSLHSRGSRSSFSKEGFPSSLHHLATTFSEIENRDCTAKGVGYDLNSRSFEEHQKLRTGCHKPSFLGDRIYGDIFRTAGFKHAPLTAGRSASRCSVATRSDVLRECQLSAINVRIRASTIICSFSTLFCC